MKRIIIVIILAFIISACDKSSDRDTDTSMRIKPGTLTAFNSPATGGTVNGATYNYAIIYNGVINGNYYIGISISNNPDPEATESFNLKIYFQDNTIPASKTISSDADATIVYYDGTNTYRNITGGGPLTLNFGTPVITGSYSIYPITTSGTALQINAFTLNSININALKTP